MNDSMLWVKGSRCYEQFRDMDDINGIMLWAQGSRCYELVKVVNDMTNLGSHELKALDTMNNSGLWMIWTIPSR